MDGSTAILVTLIVYKAVLVGIGLFAQRRTRDGTDFFLGGRKLGPVIAALSASASSSSAWTILSVSATAWKFGLSALWLFPACVGGFLLNWCVLAPALNRFSHESKAVTVTDVLAGSAGRPLRRAIVWVCSFVVLVSLIAYVASQFQGAGKAFEASFGVDVNSAILIGAAVVVFYTLLGGFWAVSITDTLQGLLMAATSVILPAVAFLEVGGFSGLMEGLPQVGEEGYLSLFRNMAPVAGIGLVLGMLGIGIGYPGQPHVVNRFMALKDEPGAMRQARRIALAWAIIVYAGMLLLGLCGRVLVESAADQEQIFFLVAAKVFSPVVAGIMIAAVLSAIMSTADSMLLVAASSVTNDLGFKGSTQRSLLLRSRIIVLLIAAIALVPAIFWDKDIFNNVLFAWSAMGAAFGPVLLVTVLRGSVGPRATLLAIIMGFTLSVGSYELRVGAHVDPNWGIVMERVGAFLVSLVVAWCGSTASQRGPSHAR